MVYRDRMADLKTIVLQEGFRRFIESRRYIKTRQKYLEFIATLPNRKLDARVNQLLQGEEIMLNKERSPRKEKKKKKKPK